MQRLQWYIDYIKTNNIKTNMDNFEKWFNKVNEELAVSPTVNTEVATEVSAGTDSNIDRNDMIGDIDNIMTSLETLASELTEELSIELELNEDVKDVIKTFITGMKASKAQAKVNKIKINAADLEFAADKFDGDKKKSIQAKSTKVGEQAKELQTMVNDRFSGKGSYVDGKLHKAKIEGQIQIIKRTSGMEDDPSKKADLKTKMIELTDKYKEESKALKALEDDNKDAAAEAQAIASGKAPKDKKEDAAPATAEETPAPEDTRTDKEKQDDAAADKQKKDAAKTTTTEETPTEETPTEETPTEETPDEETPDEETPDEETNADKIAKIEADIKTINDNTEDAKSSIVAKTKELDQAKRDVENGKGSSDTVQKIEKAIDDEKEDIKELKSKEAAAKKELSNMSPQESLIYRATEASLLELASEISEKAAWQLDNTVLYTKYDTIIKKTGYDSIITESSSIKDKFNTLLNS